LLASVGYWSLLIVAGCACGFLNTLASSGSVVSLPILVMLGLPEGAANATNRLPVFIGSVMAAFSFTRAGALDWRSAAKLAPVAASGSVLGALLAERLGNRQMGLAITAAVLLALLLLFTKIKQALSREINALPSVSNKALIATFLVGVWLGFIVLDGATYLLLVLMLMCSYPLAEANALKVLLIAITTLIPIALFSGAGDIAWLEGGVLALGSILGGHLGARLSIHPKARTWAYRVLVVVILLELAHLAWHYSAPYRATL
jgi:uncharacterized membrane protein YfcA